MNLIKPAVFAVVLIAALLLTPLAYPHSDSWQYPQNNNNVILAQTKGGDYTKAGDVKIEFYGHMAFKITSPVGIYTKGVSSVLSTLSTAEKWVGRQPDLENSTWRRSTSTFPRCSTPWPT